jgi:hypothetical protein
MLPSVAYQPVRIIAGRSRDRLLAPTEVGRSLREHSWQIA